MATKHVSLSLFISLCLYIYIYIHMYTHMFIYTHVINYQALASHMWCDMTGAASRISLGRCRHVGSFVTIFV